MNSIKLNNNIEAFINSSSEVYFELLNGEGFTISFESTIPCLPIDHEGFNNIRYASEIIIYDYDGIYDITPYVGVLRDMFPRAEIIIE